MVYELDGRPSINFVSGHQTVSHYERDYRQLTEHFKEAGAAVGITTAYYFERLKNRGAAVIEISRDTGFVLFRPAETEQISIDTSSPPQTIPALPEQ